MALTATGLGTGLDVSGLVEQLVAAERLPTSNRLNLQEARTNAELSGLGQFKSALSTFRGSLANLTELENFQNRKVTIGDDTFFTATADTGAVPGSYDINVISLAAPHRLASQAFTDSATVVGDGLLTIEVDGTTANISIDSAKNTLADIRDAINSATNNPGVSATIVNAADGSRLLISSDKTGANQTMKITTSGGDGGLIALTYDAASGSNPMTETEAAADALITISGYSVTSENNTVTGAIDGVTINLLATSAGATENLSISFDKDAASATISGFVSAYNGLLGSLNSLTNYDPEGGKSGALLGDATVRTVKDKLRRDLSQAMPELSGSYTSLVSIGITTESNGFLSIDADKLTSAIADDFDDVGKIFASTNGIAVRMDEVVENTLGSAGTIETRESSLKTILDRVEDQREILDRRMESVRSRLLDQFNAMDRLVAQLNTTSSFLSAQLASISQIR